MTSIAQNGPVPVQVAGAPAPIGPYAPAVRAGPFLYASGQTPLDPVTGALVEGDVAVQTRQVLSNLHAVLAAAGLTWRDVAKTTVFMTDLSHFSTMNAVYAEVFGDVTPARSTIGVAALPRGASVEIELVALLRS
jgi:2-iminobutanoate/2-iminopropanoate deaminase